MNNTNEDIIRDQECQDVINKKDYYEILGVKKDATEEDIRKAYKKRAIKFHPDKNQSQLASEAFKKVSHAFSVLSNEEKKRNYDNFGSEDGISANPSRNFDFDGEDPFVTYNNSRKFSKCFSTEDIQGPRELEAQEHILFSKTGTFNIGSIQVFPGDSLNFMLMMKTMRMT
jgi:DnaJ-class molecular chaperone